MHNTFSVNRSRIPILAVCFIFIFSVPLLASSVTVSWQPNLEEDLAGYKVYYGTQPGVYSQIVDVGDTTSHDIGSLNAGTTYYIAVTAYDVMGNESEYSIEESVFIEDTDPPTVVSAVCTLVDRVRVIFNEPVEETSAEIISNYAISNGIVVQSAELQPDNRTVLLNTTQHVNGAYVLVVSNVRDRAAVPNPMISMEINYTWNGSDATPPTVVSSELLLGTLLAVTFSEPLNQYTALDSSNYAISPSLRILSRGIDETFRKVYLTTESHTPGQSYQLSINNVEDGVGNSIVPNTQVGYVCLSADTVAPILISASLTNATELELQFNEALNTASAEFRSNYTISPPISIVDAELSVDKTVVTLTTPAHTEGNYTVNVSGVGDDASPSNIIVHESLQYAYVPPDMTPPNFSAVEISSNNILAITFDETVDESSATNKTNYTIDPPVNILSASLDGSKQIVYLVTEAHPEGDYRVIVNGVKDQAGNSIQPDSDGIYRYDPPDEIAPTVLSAKLHGSNLVELVFSESLDRTSSEDMSHYTIDPNVEILEASLVGDSLNRVYIRTEDHPEGIMFTMTMQNILDRADVPNMIESGTQILYERPSIDTEAPRLVAIELQGNHYIQLTFNEPLERASAEDSTHYIIDPSIPVLKATLDASLQTVLLRTESHIPGTDYTLTVQNVIDLATPPNTIGQQNSLQYTCVSEDLLPPELIRAELLGNMLIELRFSEAIEEISALEQSHYTIDNQIAILDVKLSRSQEEVFLTTSPHIRGTYTVTVTGVKDLAEQANVIQQNNQAIYTYNPPDTISPVLMGVTAMNETMIKLLFDEPLYPPSAIESANYSINNGIDVLQTFLDANKTNVILQTSSHTRGNYTISINGVQDGSGGRNEVSPNTVGYYSFDPVDDIPPQALSAYLDDERSLIVEFNEPLNQESAEDASHYVINNNISVSSALLTSQQNRVILGTSSHLAGEYILTLNGIQDASSQKNPIAPYSQIRYSWSPVDTLNPEVVSANLHMNNSLQIVFSEPVASEEARKISNYSIQPEIQILNAILDADANIVWLTTAPHEGGPYTVTVSHMTDRASTPNPIGSNNSAEYRYDPPDTVPPGLESFQLKSPMMMELLFDEEISRETAENVTNYSITPDIKIHQAFLHATRRRVILETDPHQSHTNYTIRITGLEDRAPNPNGMTEPMEATYSYTPPDTEPPQLLSVKPHNFTLLEIIFNEALEQKSAETRDNYRVDMGVEVQSATLDTTTLRRVFLTTTNHMPGIVYNINVRGVRDRSAIPNTIADNTWFSYSLTASGGSSVDNTPPRIARLELISASQLDVVFSETVDFETAQKKENYTIEDSIEVESAVLDSNMVRVHLTTTRHQIGKPYSVSISNIKDRASQPNTLSVAESIPYVLAKGASMSQLSQSEYQWLAFRLGNPEYVDRNYTITQAPDYLEESIQILTANDHKTSTEDDFLRFELRGEGTVYVARDTRIDSIPNWLSEWKVTGDQIVDSRMGVFRLYMKEMKQGCVVLGGNHGTSDDNMYHAFIVPHLSSGALLSHLNKPGYELEHLIVGDTYYIDRNYTIAAIPDTLKGLMWIRTANDDKVSKEDAFLEFTLSEKSIVYVAYDERIASLPRWLVDWDRLDEQIVDSRGTRFDVFCQTMEEGDVVLGGNCGSMDDNMYFVLVSPVETDGLPDPDSELPGYFTLTQNYPNPFNPETTIPYTVQQEGRIVITVYNVLGQAVRMLVDDVRAIGQYQVVWDSMDEFGQRVASGIYFYRLKQGDFAKTRRMILMR